MSTPALDKSQSIMTMSDSTLIFPLDDFTPELDLENFDIPMLLWPVDKGGRRVAVGLCALGFTVGQEGDLFRMRLDAAADQRLLKLYDVVTYVRWRNPDRQVDLFDEPPTDENNLVLSLNGGRHE